MKISPALFVLPKEVEVIEVTYLGGKVGDIVIGERLPDEGNHLLDSRPFKVKDVDLEFPKPVFISDILPPRLQQEIPQQTPDLHAQVWIGIGERNNLQLDDPGFYGVG